MRVDGMDCNNCAQSIHRFLEREGLRDVMVNFQTREVRYRREEPLVDQEQVRAGIEKLGFTVLDEGEDAGAKVGEGANVRRPTRRLLFCLALTAPLLLGHLLMSVGVQAEFFHNRWLQLALAGPVYLVGGWHFARSAWAGLRQGYLNMDVLIFLGSTAAFVYSLIGFVWQNPDYYFFETAATIITLVLLGNYLEARAVARTTTAIGALTRLREEKASLLTSSGTVIVLPVTQIRPGQTLRLNHGSKIPLDGTLTNGHVTVDEALLTGESLPVDRGVGERVLGGSLVTSGSAEMTVTAGYRDGTLARIIELVKTAQADKPGLQRLADRVSAIFVPTVIGLSVLTFVVGWATGYATATQALMNAIAVLLISCPCAMGLATPTAVMVGAGRLARLGVLIRGGSSIERLATIERMVFDKTGTLTTGRFSVSPPTLYADATAEEVRSIIHTLEGHSSHPIATSIRAALSVTGAPAAYDFAEVEELPGRGLRAVDSRGNQFYLGSPNASPGRDAVSADDDVVLWRNDELLAGLRFSDELRPAAAELIEALHADGIETVLLTGDRQAKAHAVASRLGIDAVFAEQLPEDKLAVIERLSRQKPTAMVGDGINDAAALSRADLGISLGGASDVALDAARVVLLRDNLSLLVRGRRVASLTLRTIRESLFWAFSYNAIAIPLAALGYLNPMWAALFMAFSDVVVIGNAIRLKTRRAE